MSNRQHPNNPLSAVPDDNDDVDVPDDISSLGLPEPEYHPLLQVWREVLAPTVTEKDLAVLPQWASRIITQYPEIGFADMNGFRDLYYDRVEELRQILLLEIESDDQCLQQLTMEDDRVENAVHYKNLLLLWQLAVQQWELDWDTASETAAIELASISEVHKMFFGENGLIAHLEVISFEFTDDDRDMLGAALNEAREGAGE